MAYRLKKAGVKRWPGQPCSLWRAFGSLVVIPGTHSHRYTGLALLTGFVSGARTT
ncbi:MAG: hypothetical protein OHK0046_29600 [Anaerolineae bacterium]